MQSDATVGSRNIEINAEYKPEIAPNPPLTTNNKPLRIERPPVLFLHGLWGSAESWGKFPSIKDDPRWNSRIHRADYSQDHGKRLSKSTPFVKDFVGEAKLLVDPLTVVTQVDIVAHSMGGILLRKHVDSGNYGRKENMGRGDFHKVLFLDVPHKGSPLANLTISVREVMFNPWAFPGKRAYALSLFLMIMLGFDVSSIDQVYEGAVDDLSVGSPELANLRELNVPCHAHVGDAARFWDDVYGKPFWKQITKTDAIAAILLSLDTYTDLLKTHWVLKSSSDLVVDTDSQIGGLSNSENYLLTDHFWYSIHHMVTKYEVVGDLAEEWALHSVSDPSFFADSMPGGGGGAQPVPQIFPASAAETQDSLPDFAGIAIEITEPTDGATVYPGEAVDITVQSKSFRDLYTGFVFYPGGALYDEDLDGGFQEHITIPDDYAGPFKIMAISKLTGGQVGISEVITLNVNPAIKPGCPTVTALRVEPTHIVLSGPGSTRQLRVLAMHSDGIERDLAATALGTSYTDYWKGVIEVTHEGVVIAVAPGETAIRATNSQITTDLIPITVLDGEATNNAPFADAGGPYFACDGHFVYLDGSESSDVDEILGDNLFYEWDADADGFFDDATGANPLVQITLPGEHSIIGLRVTDSGGLTSTAFALLESGPGCLDGEFKCSFLNPTGGIADVETDAAGNIYVFSNDMIIKHGPDCDSLTAFSVVVSNGDMAVSPNGTAYVPQGHIIYKYATDGTPLPSVNIGYDAVRIAVDTAGNIYGLDDNEAIIRKFDGSGGLLTAWNVSQEVGRVVLADKITVDSDETIYMSEYNSFQDVYRIYRGVVQPNGSYILDRYWGTKGTEPGQFDRLVDIAVGSDGDVYAVDQQNNRIQRFRSDSTFVQMWKGSGQTNGGFCSPEEIALDAFDNLVVTDNDCDIYGPDRVQIFSFGSHTLSAQISSFVRQDTSLMLFQMPDTAAAGCPKGDGDKIVVFVAVDSSSVAGPIPKEWITIEAPPVDSVVFYAPVHADSDAVLSDGAYRTTITVSSFGGCAYDSSLVKLNGVGIGFAPINMRSPDMNVGVGSYGVVDVVDLAEFAAFYPTGPKAYCPCADYRPPADATVDVVDLGFFAGHYLHETESDSCSGVSRSIVKSAGTIKLEFTEEIPSNGEHVLRAQVVLENVENYSALALAINNGNRILEYVDWHSDPSYPGEAFCTDVIRNGQPEIFIGVIGTGKFISPRIVLGHMEFRVNSDKPVELTDSDLAITASEILVAGGDVLTFRGAQREAVTQPEVYRFGLAQNYPNPFNPTTTIAYSIAELSDVKLAIYGVRGELVRTLVDGRRVPNNYRVVWNGKSNSGNSVASGVYFYRLIAGDFRATKKMVLLR